MDTNFVTRQYNQLQLIDGKVVKTCPTDRAINETLWFERANLYIPHNIPQIYGECKVSEAGKSKYVMEKIDGTNLFQFFKKEKNEKTTKKILNSLLDLVLNKMGSEEKYVSQSDIDLMYLQKPLSAITQYLDQNSDVFDVKPILSEIFESLKYSLYNPTTSFIHGDLTFSNTLIDSKNNLYLIDPRGTFGQTRYFGDKRYDLAKIYYSLIGNFDSLNIGDFRTTLKKGIVSFDIKDLGLSRYEKYFFDKIKVDQKIIKYIHATIWLSLPPHMADDPQKARAAYEQGVKYLKQIKL